MITIPTFMEDHEHGMALDPPLDFAHCDFNDLP